LPVYHLVHTIFSATSLSGHPPVKSLSSQRTQHTCANVHHSRCEVPALWKKPPDEEWADVGGLCHSHQHRNGHRAF